MISEYKAWCRIAKLWREATYICCIDKYCTYGDFICICGNITDLYFKNIISYSTYSSMKSKMDKSARKRKKDMFDFFWPCNKNGAKNRAKFCEKQILLLKRDLSNE